MSFMVVVVIDDPEDCSPLLDEWERLGIKGATILNSSGLGRFRQAGLRDDIPLMPSLRDLFMNDEVQHRTLFSVVEDEQTVDRMTAAAQKIMGDLDEPHSGFLFVVPVLKAFGLGGKRP